MKTNEELSSNDHWMQKRKNELFDEARNAAARRDLPSLSNAHEKLVSFYTLLKQLEAIQPESSSIKLSSNPAPAENTVIAPPKSAESDKERGERVRTKWISMNLYSALTPIRGSLYRKTNGDKLGIAYGEEKSGREDRWFLGLPAGKFDSAVLLCQPLTRNLFWVTLPKEFIAKHNPHLSRSRTGQVKFLVFKRAENYYLRVPRTDPIPVTEYVGKIP